VQVADRAKSLPTSRTLEINALAQKLRSQGVDVVNMTAGEPDFPTPQPVIEAAYSRSRYTRAPSEDCGTCSTAVSGKVQCQAGGFDKWWKTGSVQRRCFRYFKW